MCGRYSAAQPDSYLEKEFDVAEVVGEEPEPSWNVAPIQLARGAAITLQSVAAEGRVSRDFLYRSLELRGAVCCSCPEPKACPRKPAQNDHSRSDDRSTADTHCVSRSSNASLVDRRLCADDVGRGIPRSARSP